MDNKKCPNGDDGRTCSFRDACDRRFNAKYTSRKIARAERQAFNVAIQGGSADITNEALLRFRKRRKELGINNKRWHTVQILGQIYDALYFLCPVELIPTDPVAAPDYENIFKVLRESMEFVGPEFYVPITAEIEPPATNWSLIH
jgi:DNA polymerase I-like protein with 3'-5' exonuclease and polymerase domains